jgi:periplasmic divalent cation tolerance protein
VSEILPEDEDTIVEVWVNCPDEETASIIAEAAIGERLAAAANIYPPISSLYRWRAKVEHTSEVPLVLKTRRSSFDRLASRIAALHSYETPSIIARDLDTIFGPYRSWVIAETTP